MTDPTPTETFAEKLAQVLPCECYSRHSRGEVRHWPHCLIHSRPAILALLEAELETRVAKVRRETIEECLHNIYDACPGCESYQCVRALLDPTP